MSALISGHTRLIAHIGVPTESFRAPMIYNPWFAECGADVVVVPMGCEAADFPTFLRHVARLRNFAGALITIETQVLQGKGKKMHLFHTMREGERLVATGEHFLLHVSLETRASAPPAPHVEAALVKVAEAHAGLPLPEGAGAAIRQPC